MSVLDPTPDTAPVFALDRHVHRIATRLAAEQATPYKGKQVYLNTLAVHAARTYLQCLGVRVAPDSERQQPSLRAAFDAADLVLPGRGTLDCRPLLPAAEVAAIPPESAATLGCAVVRLNETLEQAALVGYAPPERCPGEIAIAQLDSLDALVDAVTLTRLPQWFEGLFASDWVSPETLLTSGGALRGNSTPPIEFATETVATTRSISRGKAVHWGEDLAVVLVLRASLRRDLTVGVCARLYPFGHAEYLPAGLQATVFDRSDALSLSVRAGDRDDWLQLDFLCQPGEPFSLELRHGNATTREEFVT